MSPDLFINAWPAWVAVGVSGLLAFNRFIEESKKFAGFFGEWGRKRHEKALRRHRLDMQASYLADAVQQAVEDARKQWLEDENEAINALQSRLDAVGKVQGMQAQDMAEMQLKQRALMAYTEYETAWHHRFRVLEASSENNCVDTSKMPPYIDFWQFEQIYRERGSGRDWWGL